MVSEVGRVKGAEATAEAAIKADAVALKKEAIRKEVIISALVEKDQLTKARKTDINISIGTGTEKKRTFASDY